LKLLQTLILERDKVLVMILAGISIEAQGQTTPSLLQKIQGREWQDSLHHYLGGSFDLNTPPMPQ
jgi:hypothetical protein